MRPDLLTRECRNAVFCLSGVRMPCSVECHVSALMFTTSGNS